MEHARTPRQSNFPHFPQRIACSASRRPQPQSTIQTQAHVPRRRAYEPKVWKWYYNVVGKGAPVIATRGGKQKRGILARHQARLDP